MSIPPAEAERLYDYQEITLDNGLRVITQEEFGAPLVAVQMWYHVGSKDERPDRQGFAHMFEHMMFRGTDLLEPEEHFELIRQTGGYTNAFTSFDFTAYVNVVPSNQLELALWLEADRMMYLDVTQENFDVERQVVIEERQQYLNRPYGAVFEQLMPVVFQEHPYRWMPIGQIPHLNAAEIEELKQFWDTYYVPANATLVIVGAVSHEEAQEMAERYFGWMPALPEPPRVDIEEPEQTEPREIAIREGIGPAPFVRQVYRAVPKRHPDYLPLEALARILGGDDSSRLYQDLVMDRRICQDAHANLLDLQQDGLFMSGAMLLPDDDVDESATAIDRVIEAIEEHIEALRTEPATERELRKVKNQMLREAVTNARRVEDKARQLGQTTIQYGSPEWLNKQMDAIEAITLDDVQRVAIEYLAPERRTLVRVKPEEGYVYVPDAEEKPVPEFELDLNKAGIERPDWFPLEPPLQEPLKAMPEPNSETFELDNGLEVVVVSNHATPYVSAMLGLKHGAWTEDPAQPGVASMAMQMITKGTENYTAAELVEKIEYNALTLSGAAELYQSPSMDVGQVRATALTDKLPIAMELMAEVVLRPTFPTNELEILKQQRRLSLSVQERNPQHMADRELRKRMYGDHPYARSPQGELADVDGLNADAVREWWSTHVRPDTTVLYLSGDVTVKQAQQLAEEALGDWRPDTPAPEVDYPPLPERQPTQIHLVDNPTAVQSQIRVGQISITRGHPDYHSARVFSQIYGSGFSSRLNNVIRVERGLTYHVFGLFLPQKESGEFLSGTFTQTETTSEATQAILNVMKSMRTDPPTDAEIEGAKSFLVGSFARQYETPQDLMGFLWVAAINDLPEDYLQQAVEGYLATTRDDLVRIAEEIVDTDHLTIVVVGQADPVKESLDQIAPVAVEEIELPEVEPEMPAGPAAPDLDDAIETE